MPIALRSISAVAWQNFRSMLRYRTWPLSWFGFPLAMVIQFLLATKLFAGPHGAELSTFASQAGTSYALEYTLIGLILYLWLTNSIWYVGMQLQDELQVGTFEHTYLATGNIFYLLAGYALANWIRNTVALGISFCLLAWGFGMQLEITPLTASLIIGLPGLATFGFALVFGGLVLWFKDANSLALLVQAFLLLLSGVVYPVSALPVGLRLIAQISPLPWAIAVARGELVIGLDMLRAGEGLLLPPLTGLAINGVFWLLAGMVMFRYFARRAKSTGGFGTF